MDDDEKALIKLAEQNEKIKKGRIITHSDFDGLFSALLMCEITGIPPEDVVVMEPWEVRKDEFNFWNSDFVVDLPRPNASIQFWADHHVGDSLENMECRDFAYVSGAPSAARVIFNKFVKHYPQIAKYERDLAWADKIDTASYTLEEFNNHNTHSQISLTLRSLDKEYDKYFFRTLLSTILNYGFEATANNPFVQAKYQYKIMMIERYKQEIKPFITIDDGIIIVDTRNVDTPLPKGNSVHLFCDNLDARAAVIVSKHKFDETNRFHVGENPFFKDKNKVNIGRMMAEFGGGGHKGVGGCEIEDDAVAETTFQKFISTLKEQGSRKDQKGDGVISKYK